jgi:xanthine dehydrogenase accessory factor
MEFIYDKIAEILKTDQKTALCTIVSTKGSTPLKAGAKMIVWENGKIFGTIGGGRLEHTTISDAIKVIKNNKAQLFKHDLKSQHQMCCGGSLEIFIEPIMKKKRLYIFGAGHIGKAIVKHALDLDFELFVIDDRENIFQDWTLQGYDKMNVAYSKVLSTLPFDDASYIVIATFDHSTDREVLSYCIKKPYYYLGMIGSKNKIATTKDMFISSGIATKEELDKVDMPIGLDINADTSDEIAISIVAKLIQEKNKITKA